MRWRSLLLALVGCLISSQVWAALAIDGTCAANKSSVASTIVLTQTTADTNDIIVIGVHNERTSAQGSFASASIADTSGLSWHLRKQNQFLSTGGSPVAYNDSEEWWALSPAALTADVITITFSTVIDDATAGSCGVNGANTTNPFDNNVSLAAAATGISGVSEVTMSTSATNTMLLGFAFNATGQSQAGTGQFGSTSATSLDFNETNLGGVNDSAASLQHLNVAAAQSSIIFQPNTGSAVWQVFGDAICASGEINCTGGSVVSTPHNLLLLGVGQ